MAKIRKYNFRCPSCDDAFSVYLNEWERAEVNTHSCQVCKSSTLNEIEEGKGLNYKTMYDIRGEDPSKVEVSVPEMVSGVNLRAKVPGGFKDVLSKIKAAHPLHKIGGELS